MTRAMILAAGFGTRLGTLSDERPKPLLPVADHALIRYGVALLRGHGVSDVVVNLHHRGELITDELGAGRDLGVKVTYSPEEHILGTGGGIRHALPLLGDDPFFVVNGKVIIDLDLDEVLASHRGSGAAATLVVRPDPDARRWNAIDAPPAGGPIRALLADGDFMFTGIHVIEPSLVARLPDDGLERCIVRQGYIPWLAAGTPLNAFVSRGYFAEHSTPARYLEGNINILHGRASLRHVPGPLVGVDPAAEVHPDAKLVSPVRIAPRALISRGAVVGPDVVVGHDARVDENVHLTRAVIWPHSHVITDATDAIITPHQTLPVRPP